MCESEVKVESEAKFHQIYILKAEICEVLGIPTERFTSKVYNGYFLAPLKIGGFLVWERALIDFDFYKGLLGSKKWPRVFESERDYQNRLRSLYFSYCSAKDITDRLGITTPALSIAVKEGRFPKPVILTVRNGIWELTDDLRDLIRRWAISLKYSKRGPPDKKRSKLTKETLI